MIVKEVRVMPDGTKMIEESCTACRGIASAANDARGRKALKSVRVEHAACTEGAAAPEYGYIAYIEGYDSIIDSTTTIASREEVPRATDAQEWCAAQMGKTAAEIDGALVVLGGVRATSWRVTRYRLDTDCADQDWEITGRRSPRAAHPGPFIVDVTDWASRVNGRG